MSLIEVPKDDRRREANEDQGLVKKGWEVV